MRTDVSLSVLDRMRVASPCTARWEDMALTRADHVRRCEQCNLNVHNLSGMTRHEAEALVSSHFSPGGWRVGQRLCGQWRRRTDGTIIFGDCPVGLAKLRMRLRRSMGRFAALAGLSSLLAACADRTSTSGGLAATPGSVAVDDSWIGGEMAAPDPAQDEQDATESSAPKKH